MLDGLDNPSEVKGGRGPAQGITKSRGSLTPLKKLCRGSPPPLLSWVTPPEGKPFLVLLWVLVLNFFTYQSFILLPLFILLPVTSPFYFNFSIHLFPLIFHFNYSIPLPILSNLKFFLKLFIYLNYLNCG